MNTRTCPLGMIVVALVLALVLPAHALFDSDVDKAKEFILVRDLYSPELAIKVRNASTTDEAEKIRAEWEKDEHKKMNSFVKELNLKGLNINLVTLFSKKSFETNRYVEAMRADIFVVTSPEEKPKLMDRVFMSKIEYTFKQLPCTLLISNTVKDN